MLNSNVLNETQGADNRNLTIFSRCTMGFITLPIHILLTLTAGKQLHKFVWPL